MGLKKIKTTSEKQILAFTEPRAAVGVIVGSEGVEAASNGKKIIPAGTPVGGGDSSLSDGSVILNVTNTADTAARTQGVLLHDVDVTAGKGNGTMLIFGFVNEYRLGDLVIADEAKKQLNGKVTFIKRNK